MGREPNSPVSLCSAGADLSQGEILQYSRQLILDEVGVGGQRRLKGARVLVVGAGGLGAPVLLYLASAGVGTIGIVEHDLVEQSNLHRQVLFTTQDIGRPKLEVACEKIAALNPYIHIEPYAQRLDIDNVRDIISRYDIVVDATDNFASRYLINDTCVLFGKPNVSASIFRFEGQVSVYWAQRGPCYRCLYSEPPPPELAPSCSEAGVLGVLPGIVGTLQANEVIKLILGCGEPLIGRVLRLDASGVGSETYRIQKNANCLICSPAGEEKALTAYNELCSSNQSGADVRKVTQISVLSLKQMLDDRLPVTLLDIRNGQEYEIARIPGATLMPLDELPDRLNELSGDGQIVCYCHKGKRSLRAASLLKENGFNDVRSLTGGIDTWSLEVDSGIPRY